MVDATRPAHQPFEAVRFEVNRKASRRYKDTRSRVMKTTQKSINPPLWYEGAGRNIFREFGVITCCKTQILFQAVAPSGETKRSFGGNVNMTDRPDVRVTQLAADSLEGANDLLLLTRISRDDE